jgi:hypothetical protein
MPPDGTKAAPKRRRSPARGQPAVALHPLRDWRTFVGEIGIVVIGVLLALGAQQLVETIQNRSRVAEMTDKLRAESLDNQRVADYDLAQLAELNAAVDRDIAALDGCRDPGAARTLEAIPQDPIFLPGTGAWQAIGDNALMPLMPPLLAENHVKIASMINGGYASRMLDLRRSLDRTTGAVEILRGGAVDGQLCNEALLALGELKQTAIGMIQLAHLFREANGRALRGARVDVDIGSVQSRQPR